MKQSILLVFYFLRLILALRYGTRNTVNECTPIAYRCSTSNLGWDVCDSTGHWVNGGSCAAGETCQFNAANGSPYCLPPGSSNTVNTTACCISGQYLCLADSITYASCNTATGQWVPGAMVCPAGQQCVGGAGAMNPHVWCMVKPDDGKCTPPAYRCKVGNPSQGWEVCTAWGSWVDGGNCGTGTTCKFNSANGSPYCL